MVLSKRNITLFFSPYRSCDSLLVQVATSRVLALINTDGKDRHLTELSVNTFS